jgi:tRNA A64-2'-O-ribosylphosphate transferase
MPDALSKTVPIWCAVINRAIRTRRQKRGLDFDSALSWDFQLYTPPGIVSAQEHHQVVEKLDGWAEALAVSLVAYISRLS